MRRRAHRLARSRIVPLVLVLAVAASGSVLAGPRVYVGFGAGWGWGWGGLGCGWPYYYPYAYPSYPYPYVYPAWGWAPGPVYASRGDSGPLPATVQTKIKPKKAMVVVDGEALGMARDFDGDWNVIGLDPGRHVIEFSSPGFQTFRTVLDARAGTSYRIGERLNKGEGLDPRSAPLPEEPAEQPAPAVARAEPEPVPSSALRTGLLWLRVTPPDASVYLDGRFLGSARELASLHGAIPVASGTHRVEALMPGYAGQRREITVEGKSPLDVQIDLERQ